MNAFETNCIREIAKKLNMNNYIFVNTCTITGESERQCRQEIRKLHRQNPDYRVILTGCASQLHPEFFIKMPEVDFVISNEFKLQQWPYKLINDYFLNHCNDIKLKQEIQQKLLTQNNKNIPENKQPIDDNDWEYIYNFKERSRAFVPVQTGCNHFCSYCIVPFTRGKFRSYPPEHIIEQIKIFVENGYNEVVLTGIDITDYGKDVREQQQIDTLGKLCKTILKQTSLKRLRLSSVDVAEIDNDILDLIANETRFMPYFHISLQSGSNDVLKRMRRRHTYQDVIDFCDKVLSLRPESAFGADIITGFPEETDEEFKCSVDIVKNAPISFVHAFPYSKRENTLASLMNDNVPKKIKKERVNELIKIGQQNLLSLYKTMESKPQKCIIERNGIARAENFAKIELNLNKKHKKLENNFQSGEIVLVVPSVKNNILIADKITAIKDK